MTPDGTTTEEKSSGSYWGIAAKTASTLFLAVHLTGCGTLLSLTNVDRDGELHGLVYGGVRLDARCAFDPDYCGHILFAKPFFALDIPVSLAADTVALPYTATKQSYSQLIPESTDLRGGQQQDVVAVGSDLVGRAVP
jgi:uncharacterized protein YceK